MTSISEHRVDTDDPVVLTENMSDPIRSSGSFPTRACCSIGRTRQTGYANKRVLRIAEATI
jgi:hypothetical protein